jgi:hypothetical protein
VGPACLPSNSWKGTRTASVTMYLGSNGFVILIAYFHCILTTKEALQFKCVGLQLGCPIFFFFGSVGVWIQGFALARQALYAWAVPPALFAFDCFSGRFLSFCLAGLGLGTSYLCLSCSWSHRHIPPCSANLLGWGLANFLLGLVSWSPRPQ